jgi:nitrite reductase (NO-forming)
MISCAGDETGEDLKASMQRGAMVYRGKCLTCHMSNGQGVPNVYPPLAASDYMMADRGRAIKQVIYGAEGEMVVNGQIYNNIMPPQDLTDKEAADVLNYIFNSWGNKGDLFTPEEVAKNR